MASHSTTDLALRAAHAGDPRRHGRRIAAELEALLGVALPPPHPPSVDELFAALASSIEQQVADPAFAFDAAATRELIGALATDREQPLGSLVRDLAEILLLERRARSEYVDNRTGAPPYRIGKLLLEYAVGARRVDGIIGALTKGFCAASCDRLPVGCCSIDGYDMGVVPTRMLELQVIEARRNGWQPPAGIHKCKFHGARGCTIALFKSPACIGMLCEALFADLRQRFPSAAVEPFLARLAVLRNCDIDRERVFAALNGVIEAGAALVDPDARPAL